eukprot:CAMPEP_0172698938 /NCGR_PEP_ID=MMETSP1074-20121228/29812_1 /TAXON_ID=2916 /ORGANISM="Ceratium fusus, Strain PA161109" /LENGTH=655 /DNA_ID=CAMNT_0013520051 /DNA_START=52 /DNA_END=2015 /DNA_ORIENTATION=+
MWRCQLHVCSFLVCSVCFCVESLPQKHFLGFPSAAVSELPSCAFARVEDAKLKGAYDRFNDLRTAARPALLAHAIDGWPALQEWAKEPLLQHVGAHRLSSGDVHPGVLGDGWREGAPLSAMLERATASAPNKSSRLLLFRPSSKVAQSLKPGFEIPPLLQAVQRSGPQVSIGGKGQGSVFNSHQQNWLAQVFGRKLWMVYEPGLPEPPYTAGRHPCEYMALERTLPLESRTLQSCVVHPGELLYLPDSWPHSTCNLDDYTVGVGYFGAVDIHSPAERAAILGHSEAVGCHGTGDAVTAGSILTLAAEAGHMGIVHKLLFECKLDPNLVDSQQQTALHAAAKNSWPEVVALLLASRSDAEMTDMNGETPVLHAASAGNLLAFQLLCGCAADDADAHADGSDTVRCSNNSLCTNAMSVSGVSSLRRAAAHGHLPIASLLLSQRASLHSTSEFASEPLEEAAQWGHTALVELLLDRRSDVNFRPFGGRTPLGSAAMYGRKAVVLQLIMRRAKLEQRNTGGKTALILASWLGHGETAGLLLEARAQPNATDGSDGRTALHWAALAGRSAAVEGLLAARASVFTSDSAGHTAFGEAARLGHTLVLKQFLATMSADDAEGQLLAAAVATKELHRLEKRRDQQSNSGANAAFQVRRLLEEFA